MTTKSLNHIRVVVHIHDGESNNEDFTNNNKTFTNSSYRACAGAGHKRNIVGQMVMIPPPSPPLPASKTRSCSKKRNAIEDNMKAEVLLIDDQTLQLNLLSTDNKGPFTNISHKMHFDYVSHDARNMIKLELAIVMDELLLKRSNVSIMRFMAKPEIHMSMFFNLLVTFINKRIYHQKYKLQYVDLEHSKISSQMDSNLAGLDSSTDDSMNNSTIEMTENAKIEFNGTSDLLFWLLNEYPEEFYDNKSHEKFQFTFLIVDHQQNLFKVKLYLFNIYLDLMNTEDRSHWDQYMDHIDEGCRGQDRNFKHSDLTKSLSGHIEGVSSENALLLFYVPTDIKMASDTLEMLQMADTVVKNRKKKENIFLNKNVNLCRRMSISSGDCSKCLSPIVPVQGLNNLSVNFNQKGRRSSLPSIIQTNLETFSSNKNVTQIVQTRSPTLANNSYSRKDLTTLSAWYRKIEERYRNLNSMREKYFNRYFELKIKQISSNIHHMFNAMESLNLLQSAENDLDDSQEDGQQFELHDLFERYRNARTKFRQLFLDIQNSEFQEILKIYLETKEFDLNKNAVNLKKYHLNYCEKYLKFAFNDIHSVLNLELDN